MEVFPMNAKAHTPLIPALARALVLACLTLPAAGCARASQSATAAPPAAQLPVVRPDSEAPPAGEPMVRGLPDFSTLVDRYGPAVVNVEVVEKASPQGAIPGLSPDDPFYDFFKRFGVPAPGQGGGERP